MQRTCLPVLLLTVLSLPAWGAEKSAEDKSKESLARLKRDLAFLASDECEGRGPTTEGINKAADYIVDQFKKAGLKPGGQAGTWFQHFSIAGARLNAPATLSFLSSKNEEIKPKAGTEFNPIGLSHSGAFREAELVFVGYGVSPDPKDAHPDFDEWKEMAVAGKVVIVLRGSPKFIKKAGERRLHGSHIQKMTQALKRDALAVLFVNDAETAKDGDDLVDFNYYAAASSPAAAKLPAFHIKRAVADKLLAAAGLDTLEKLERKLNDTKESQSVEIKNVKSSGEVSVKRAGDIVQLKNVVGVLEGKGPKANETIVIGAHYDHLGYGAESSLSGLLKPTIHNGADDNGSGTTSVLELARRFGAMPEREGRRMVFMTFSGEEKGLLGSAHYCKNPLFPLADTVAMINLDMVGRLTKDPKTGKEKLEVQGTETAKGFAKLIDDLNKKYEFDIKKSKGGNGPSDHSSFYDQKVPVFFFFTLDHPDYHRPGDKAEKINYDGMNRIVDMVQELATTLSTGARPEYVKVGGSSMGPRPNITLGIRPEYAEDDMGVPVGGVTEGEPAQKAGMKAGDRIVEMGGKPIKNLQGYMAFMREQKKGDTIDVKVVRDKKELTLKVKLD